MLEKGTFFYTQWHVSAMDSLRQTNIFFDFYQQIGDKFELENVQVCVEPYFYVNHCKKFK
jgi:hypothetical protein